MIRVYVIEDHAIMRQSLCAFVKRQPGIILAGDAATGELALQQIAEVQPDMLLIDVALSGMNGLEVLDTVRQRYPEIFCVMLSGHGERSHIQRAMSAGACGYVLKGDTDELATALQTVIKGEIYLSRVVRDKLSSDADDE